ncbi:MAG: PilZ domain-containing protein [Terriglobia bacterium]
MNTAEELKPRRVERINKRIPISLIVKTDGKETTRSGATLDISPMGLRIQTIRPLYQGQAVYLLPTKGEASSGYYRVVWVRQTRESSPPEAGLKVLN